MIKIENKYFLLLIPLIVILFLLDRYKKFQYIYKLSIMRILTGQFFHTFFYLEKIILYSILFCLSLFLAEIGIKVSSSGSDGYLIFNVPYLTDAILQQTREIIKQYKKELDKFEIYINTSYAGRHSLIDIDENILEKEGAFDNFDTDNIRIKESVKTIPIFLVKLCNFSTINIVGNRYKICIKDIDNIGIVKRTPQHLFLYNYFNIPKEVNIQIEKRNIKVSLPPHQITAVEISEKDKEIHIIEKDRFLRDNHFLKKELRIYVGEGLKYTKKAFEALGYKLNSFPEYDLCIYERGKQTNISCNYRWELGSFLESKEEMVPVEGGYNSLTIHNLKVIPDFDINNVVFNNIFKINSKEGEMLTPYLTTEQGEIIMGLYRKNGQKYIFSGFNWEDNRQTNWAQNIYAPLPIFIDALLHSLFPEYLEERELYAGAKLFSYYNNDFPDITFEKIVSQTNIFFLSPILKYLIISLFILYIFLKLFYT